MQWSRSDNQMCYCIRGKRQFWLPLVPESRFNLPKIFFTRMTSRPTPLSYSTRPEGNTVFFKVQLRSRKKTFSWSANVHWPFPIVRSFSSVNYTKISNFHYIIQHLPSRARTKNWTCKLHESNHGVQIISAVPCFTRFWWYRYRHYRIHYSTEKLTVLL